MTMAHRKTGFVSSITSRLLISTSILLVSTPIASAQNSSRGLDEIIVTAQKQAQNIQDVPIALSALSAESIINQGVGGAQALQQLVPGLVYNNTGATAQPFIRGVGTRLAQNGLELSNATYLDDRYVARPTASMFELADVERIEVLKGPQGTLYGRNATGGAIRVITKDVGDEFGGNLKASYGNFNAYTLSGSVNIPFSDDDGIRFTGISKGRDGYAKNVDPRGRAEFDDLNYQAVRAKLKLGLSDAVTSRLTVDYWQRDDLAGVENVDISPGNLGQSNFLSVASGNPIATRPGEVASQMTDSNIGNEVSAQLRFDAELNDRGMKLVSISTFSDFELDWIGDADGGGAKRLDAFVYENSTGYSQELQLHSNQDSPVTWLLGGYYFNDDHDYELTADLSDLIPNFTFSQSAQNVQSESIAIFGQLVWAMSDQTNLTLGGRWTEDSKEVTVMASTREALVLGATVPTNLSDSWSEFTPKVTIDHNFTDDMMVYATYARGFKSGGFNYPVSPAQTLNPETLDSFELGMKGEFADNTIRLNASAFYYDYKDLQVTRASGVGVGAAVTTENAANAKVMGIDMDMTWAATDNLTISAGGSLLDTEYKDYVASAFVFNSADDTAATFGETGMGRVGFDANGSSLIRAPELSFFVSGEYVVDLQNGGEIPLFLSYSYKGDYDFDLVAGPRESLLTQQAYGLLNGRVSYKPDNAKWEIGLWGQNLTDEVYFDDNVANPTGIRVNYGAPRTYGADLKVTF